jgi:hypothetical protein
MSGIKIDEVGTWIAPYTLDNSLSWKYAEHATFVRLCLIDGHKIQLQQPIMGCKMLCPVLRHLFTFFCEALTFVTTSERDFLVGQGKAKWCGIHQASGGGGGVQTTTNFYYTNCSLLSPFNFPPMYDFWFSYFSLTNQIYFMGILTADIVNYIILYGD